MPKSKLKLDIICLTPRQRRIFVKEFNNICQHLTVDSKEVQNDIVRESDVPDEQSQQQNVLSKNNFDYSNVNSDEFINYSKMNTDEFIKNNDDLTSIHSGCNSDKDSVQSNNSDGSFSKTEIINDIRLWTIENRVNQSTLSSLLKF